MYLGANGLVINELGHVLLIQRDDSRSWGLPGGGLDKGETPTEAVTREVEEETGLKTLPVRLVGLYFRQEKEADRLMFLFRCLVRGGTVTPSPESPQVGYIKYEALPSRILAIHRQQIDQGYLHAGGPPVLQRQTLPWLVGRLRDLLYGWRDWRRRRRGEPTFTPAFRWQAGAFVILRNEKDEILWAQRRDDGRWNLPGGGVEPGEAPWEAAVRETLEETGLNVAITRLTGVYTQQEAGEIIFNFTGRITSGQLQTNSESQAFQWLPAGSPPDNALSNDIERIRDAVETPDLTVFKTQNSERLSS